MNHDYSDIRSKIAERPTWWDEHAVPRYCQFAPNVTANIYARECLLLLIECQACGRPFEVCISDDHYSGGANHMPLSESVAQRMIHYGDPPNIDCCPGGATMNSVPRRVLQFWRRVPLSERTNPSGFDRIQSLEIDVTPDWSLADG